MRDATHMVTRTLLFLLALRMTSAIGSAAEVSAESALTLTFIEVRVEMRGHAAAVLRKQGRARLPRIDRSDDCDAGDLARRPVRGAGAPRAGRPDLRWV